MSQTSISRTNKEIVVESFSSILFSDSNKWTIAKQNNMDQSYQHNIEQKKQDDAYSMTPLK